MNIKYIDKKTLQKNIKYLCKEVNVFLPKSFKQAIEKMVSSETNELGKKVLSDIIENSKLAEKEFIPTCQDTGICIFYLEIGRDLHFDYDIKKVINESVKEAYKEYYFRNSVCKDPILRTIGEYNTPAIIYMDQTEGSDLKISLTSKGAGSENMSQLKMLYVSDGVEGIKDFVIKVVKEAGGKACPPLTVGIGIGGNFEYSCFLAKKALLRDINDKNQDEYLNSLEKDILNKINDLGIGPMGFGGDSTSVGVKILSYPCHIASLPVAVNLNCHASRHKTIVIKGK